MDGLILALQFFTRIPVGKEVSFNEKNIGRSLFFLPFIGLIIGWIAALPIIALHSTSKIIASLLSIIVIAAFTGGLHLDGLADTFDGFLSGRKRERVMEIMKDSTLGAFGALALVFLILFKFVAVYELPAVAWIGIPLSLANARLVAGYVILAKRNAREDGLGVLFKSSAAGRNIFMAGVIYIGIIMFINPWYMLPLVGSLVVGEAMTLWSYKKIDGLTGDVYGAIIEMCEVASLVIFWGVTIWR